MTARAEPLEGEPSEGNPSRPHGGALKLLIRHRRLIVPLLDGWAWVTAMLAAAAVRLGGDVDQVMEPWFFVVIGAAAVAQVGIGLATGLYRGRWRVATFEEVVGLGAVWAGATAVAFVINLLNMDRRFPLGGAFVGAAFAGVMMLALRAVWRIVLDRINRPRSAAARVLVFGAGEGGYQVVRAMMRDADSAYLPVALLDDDSNKRRRTISGVRVMGTRHDLERVAAEVGAQILLIAVPSANSSLVRELSKRGLDAGLDVRILPRPEELPDDFTVRSIRKVDEKDLMGRDEVTVDLASIAHYISGRKVLVTGAGGSIGSELCRQLASYGPERLFMLDRDESGLHAVKLSIDGRALLDGDDLIVADVRDRERIKDVFCQLQPEVVFHAAALKHLPLLERHPIEGFKTNVWGTENVLDAARCAGVGTFVNISTDKAAEPTSVLGATKLIAERLTSRAAADTGQCYVSVRFGNVLGSRGSVVPTFQEQIANGGPVTVTHPDATRFFMTIPEAVRLVIQAAALGQPGDTLILDMGEPVRIVDVARQLIDSTRPDVEIVFTGLRPGEKLHEVLVNSFEELEHTTNDRIFRTATAPIRPDYALGMPSEHELARLKDYLIDVALADRTVSAG